jgi:hypothetical protein
MIVQPHKIKYHFKKVATSAAKVVFICNLSAFAPKQPI